MLAVAIGVEVVSAVLAWRDMAARDAKTLRGSTTFWRWFMVMNPGNSIAYWLIGRRRGSPPA
jgi:hypothetical protein